MSHLSILFVITAFVLLLEIRFTYGQSLSAVRQALSSGSAPFEKRPFNDVKQYTQSEDGESGNHVSDTLYQMFVDTGGVLILTYEAGSKGYVARYEYKVPPPDLSKPFFASAGFLKTAAG